MQEKIDKYVVLDKEADYIFIVSKERQDVLLDQLNAINDAYTTNNYFEPEMEDGQIEDDFAYEQRMFGLLKFASDKPRRFLDYKVFDNTGNMD